jgi:DNA-binding CsgD family transcriptional regulator
MFSIQSFLTWQSKLLMTYKHLSQAERYQIHALMKAGHDQSEIAKLLDRHKSTISRELSRNTGSRGYRPKQACEMSADRGQNSRNANAVAPWVKDEVNALLRVQWSPEQIASQLPISHETVYQHVYADKSQGGTLWQNLRCQKQKRKRYAGGRVKTDRRDSINLARLYRAGELTPVWAPEDEQEALRDPPGQDCRNPEIHMYLAGFYRLSRIIEKVTRL